ncbi:MAG: DUF2950 family protein [Planctomycetes bacterium]|nr:DUF2950 family protein [Planctomycetota bacterium]
MDAYSVLPREVRNARAAVAACVCGIFGFLGVTALLGIALGALGLAHIKGSGGVLRGRGLALAGIAGGIIWSILWVVGWFVWSWYWPKYHENRLLLNETSAMEALHRMRAAEEIIDMSDKDANQAHDYWTADVAGLLKYCPDRVDVALASADVLPLPGNRVAAGASVPYGGYLFYVLKTDDTGEAYARDQDGDGKSLTNTAKFGFCAVPAKYEETGRRSFIINERGTVWSKDLGRGGGGAAATGPGPGPGKIDLPVVGWPKDTRAEGWSVEIAPKADKPGKLESPDPPGGPDAPGKPH